MKRFPILGALLLGAASLSANTSHAQTARAQTPAANVAPAAQTAEIRVRSIPADFAAYWLDPTHQPVPIQIRYSERNGGTNPIEQAVMQRRLPASIQRLTRDPFPRQAGSGYGPRDLELPTGVEIVGTIPPRNLLLVKGTTEGIAAIRTLLNEIDVPLNMVEIEARIIELAPASLQSLPLVFRDSATDEEKTPTLGAEKILDAEGNSINYGTGDFFARAALAVPISDAGPLTQKLNEGIANNSVRFITAPRVTAIDGLTSRLTSVEARAIYLAEATPTTEATDEEQNAEAPILAAADNWRKDLAQLESQTGLIATPVLHGNLINLGFQILLNNNVTAGNAVMRDGQTLAVRLPEMNPRTGWPRIALITARLVKSTE